MKNVELDELLPFVRKPGRYIGGEYNVITSDPLEAEVNFVFVFPDLYEIGMSHLGLQILYDIINRCELARAERCFAVDLDMEQQLRSRQVPLFSLESRTPLSSFDVIGFTLPYELCYTNILTVLDLAGLALRAEDRTETDPLVIAGGSCSMNPEPVADFFDAVVLGDGEEVIEELCQLLATAKRNGSSKSEVLLQMAGIDGVYVPSFFRPIYKDKQFLGMEPLVEGYEGVQRRVLPELLSSSQPDAPLVPLVKTVHDRLGVEIARGCTRGCRFCQAGIIYRPVRERPMEEIVQLAEKGIENGGYDELALLSLSTGDYSCLPQLLGKLMDRFADEYVSVSMPSMRVGTLGPDIMEQIKRVRKTGFTVAPEAGSERLRQVINKGITEQDLLDTCSDAFKFGWKLIKFYFMVGLPTETDEDVEAIAELAKKARQHALSAGHGKLNINIGVASFVPKPHTPFQWEAQCDLESSTGKINQLKRALPRKGYKLKWHDTRSSFMEGVFSRGDRKLSRLIEEAWRNGARLDGWDEHFSLDLWQRCAEKCDIDMSSYLRKRELEEALPWDHLHSGVAKSFLLAEREKGLELSYTPDCRVHGCQKCGLCDFKRIKPVTYEPVPEEKSGGLLINTDRVESGQRAVYPYRVHYSRVGDGRFLGHLEMLQLIFRALCRAEIPILYSQGFNPSPKVSFGPALAVGMESEVEYFDMELSRPLTDEVGATTLLSDQFPEFITVSQIKTTRKLSVATVVTDYQIRTKLPLDEARVGLAAQFLAADSFIVERVRKGKRKELDLRLLVDSLVITGATIDLRLINNFGMAGTNPGEILRSVLKFSDEEALMARVKKIGLLERSG
ncbi:MAG: TIGR03960 family B12-binding radical SAM protein [Desulfobulbaceae bacterium]|nr:TIGR03960 family B12-binding radical SAM protein [Desulfobulbaceae bacterium]